MKNYVLLFWALLGCVACAAQEDYVVDMNGRTIYGTIILTTPAANSVQISFKKSDGTTRRYRPDEIRLWSKGTTIFESKVYNVTSRAGQLAFMKRLTPKGGKCQVFEHYNTSGEVGYTETILEQDGKMDVVNFGRFRKHMAEYFKDYKELAEDITNKKYKKKQLLEIVERYNAWKEEQWRS